MDVSKEYEAPDLTDLDYRSRSSIKFAAELALSSSGFDCSSDIRGPVEILFGSSLSRFESIVLARQAIEEQLRQYRAPSV